MKLRNGRPNWWCHTHGLAAAGPNGDPLPRCSGAWFEPIPDDDCLELDAGDGEIAIWGVVPPGVVLGTVEIPPGKVHVHRRADADAEKDIDDSFSIVTVRHGDESIVVEGVAAVAFSLSELTGQRVAALSCSHCGEVHIDELKFATHPHAKHLCNSCGRNFRDDQPSISNPLADAHHQLTLPLPASPQPSRLQLRINSVDYKGIALWPSNAAIVSTMSRPEESGVHVHAWSHGGRMVIDETYSPVFVDGDLVDETQLKLLAVQRALSHGEPIVTLECEGCSASLSPSPGDWMEPLTRHVCRECGITTVTRRKVFVNPLAARFSR